ncbi:MAG: cobyrinate a,c-diamide synthase [Desulfobulbus oligotrophicus]|nr:cobyrinate a,c-diamide synthase [Desulfobulbus oligotrophicus]
MKRVKSVVLAGLSGGAGKSVVSVALIAALKNRGMIVAPFKKGPDYIDAGWMSKAAGRPCYNLDPYLMSPATIISTFQRCIYASDVAVIEGNRGLFDGVNAKGEYSTAELARMLDVPVLLVVNCAKTTRTIAALVLGCQVFDPQLSLAGVILNQIATSRHESIVRQSIEHYTDLPVLGVMPRLQRDVFPMRHLGLTPCEEYDAAAEAVAKLGTLAANHFDLDGISERMREMPPLCSFSHEQTSPRLTIGILRDAAFQFYYQENLDALSAAGADLVLIDALHAPELPKELDGLYIGGGFPETSARQLADNVGFRSSVRERIEAGLPVYAECGGLIFLGRSIVLDGQEYPLADVFPVTFALSNKPQAHGYSTFVVEQPNSFYPVGTRIKGHEFRYSTVHQWEGETDELILNMERGTGFSGQRDGLVKKNTLALYTHVMASGTPEWITGFIKAAHAYAQSSRQQ